MFISQARSLAEGPFEDSPEDEKLDAMMEKLSPAQRKQVVAQVKKFIDDLNKE